jgi:multicomponent Na+:H+ antiporter subunit B
MAVGILRLHNLFAVVMLSGIYSLISAGLFVTMDAVDVAFTEAAVGGGISTVLMLGTLALTTDEEKGPFVNLQPVPLLVILITGAALIYGTLDMPSYGDPQAPIHQHVADLYIAEAPVATGVPNIVTAVLASYRGYDTMGELTVIFTAGIGVMLLLGAGTRRRKD